MTIRRTVRDGKRGKRRELTESKKNPKKQKKKNLRCHYVFPITFWTVRPSCKNSLSNFFWLSVSSLLFSRLPSQYNYFSVIEVIELSRLKQEVTITPKAQAFLFSISTNLRVTSVFGVCVVSLFIKIKSGYQNVFIEIIRVTVKLVIKWDVIHYL